ADVGALEIGGAVGVGAGAILRRIARAGGRPALDGRGHENVGRTVVARPVTALGYVTDRRGRTAFSRALRIRRTGGVRARARLGDVAGAGARPALEERARDAVGRAVVAHPVAALGDVAVARCRAADGAALPVGRAVDVRSGAALGDV